MIKSNSCIDGAVLKLVAANPGITMSQLTKLSGHGRASIWRFVQRQLEATIYICGWVTAPAGGSLQMKIACRVTGEEEDAPHPKGSVKSNYYRDLRANQKVKQQMDALAAAPPVKFTLTPPPPPPVREQRPPGPVKHAFGVVPTVYVQPPSPFPFRVLKPLKPTIVPVRAGGAPAPAGVDGEFVSMTSKVSYSRRIVEES